MGFLVLILETNRSPFDISERESELVSGFNTEFGSQGFVLIFVGEYFIILVLGGIFAMVCGGGVFFWGVFVMLVLLCRAVFPRIRVDIMFLSY